ncbi:MAG: ATP-binding protein [Anaerolineae bacterium]|nr:ATP-binding protein [Anaerolineae bacterium]NUQ03406.1 GAF domain-containing protein [Anaerolineae bacterium]
MLPSNNIPVELSAAAYKSAYALSLFLGSVSDLQTLLPMIPTSVRDVLGCEQVMLLLPDEGRATFRIALTASANLVRHFDDQVVLLDALPDRPPFDAWRQRRPAVIDPSQRPPGDDGERSLHATVFRILPAKPTFSAPVSANGRLYGVLLAQDAGDQISVERGEFLLLTAHVVGVALANAARYQHAEEERRRRADEMRMMAQVDRELSDSIQLEDVFAITLDWAMRYTLAHGAYLSLFDETSGALRPVASLGYKTPPETVTDLFDSGGIAQRVALSNRAEIVPQVSLDSDYVPVSIAMNSHVSVPVTREDRVIAVISLESKQINAFTESHLEFIHALSARAGIAIDNARLYANEVREREKTASILREIADVVIVVGSDERINLINDSGISALRLYPDQQYVGRRFEEVFEGQPLLKVFRRAVAGGRVHNDTLMLPGDRTYATSFARHPKVGWIITMRDLTELRHADQLKHDFMSVLSHDLKQPVSVVSGYVELLEMRNPSLDERSRYYAAMIYQSLNNMRKLIDDLLDLARLDTDVELIRAPVAVDQLMIAVRDWIRPSVEAKSMTLHISLGEGLPSLRGDQNRLTQLFVNLVHNAVKYSPPGGEIRVEIESSGEEALTIAIRDSGMGISPEDQKAIFERFYRVRRPETENIEGSGLGLTLVKRLVDLHNGQIGLVSRLGEGTTFFVTLPIWKD